MKRALILTLFLILSAAIPAHAADRMLFWYPGEAGSTSEAQPVIDDLFEYLKGKDASLDFEGAYFNTIEGGARYLAKKKPTVAVASYPVWTMKRGDFPQGATVLLSTLPQPQGRSKEQYVIVGTKPLSDASPLFMSEPMTEKYIRAKLFPSLPSGLTLTQTASILRKIKEIAEGKAEGFALLTPMEAYTLSKMTSPWIINLKYLTNSSLVPTARVILIDPAYKHAVALKKILTEMKKDPEGVEVLDELRLRGFSMP